METSRSADFAKELNRSKLNGTRHIKPGLQRRTTNTRSHAATRPSVQRFWDQNNVLFQQAWAEWENEDTARPVLDSKLYDPALRIAVETAWKDPSKEGAVKELWQEVFPGVYETQFFDPEQLNKLRGYMEAEANADIPLRPPYGIWLNRGVAMLDRRSEGFLAATSFQSFYRDLMDAYMRPISRLLFPDWTCRGIVPLL